MNDGQQIARLTRERDHWRARAIQAEVGNAAQCEEIVSLEAALREALEVLHDCGQVEAHDRIAALMDADFGNQ